MPIAIALERRLAYVPAANPDPLLPLTLQLLFVQIVAFPAIVLVWDATPDFVPVAYVQRPRVNAWSLGGNGGSS